MCLIPSFKPSLSPTKLFVVTQCFFSSYQKVGLKSAHGSQLPGKALYNDAMEEPFAACSARQSQGAIVAAGRTVKGAHPSHGFISYPVILEVFGTHLPAAVLADVNLSSRRM